MAATKTAYTVEQSTELVNAYADGMGVQELAEKFSKSVKSIVAKLSREGVYNKPVRLTKSGDPIIKKDSLADQIGMLVRLSEADTSSLAKANKTALAAVLNLIKEAKLSKPIV